MLYLLTDRPDDLLFDPGVSTAGVDSDERAAVEQLGDMGEDSRVGLIVMQVVQNPVNIKDVSRLFYLDIIPEYLLAVLLALNAGF